MLLVCVGVFFDSGLYVLVVYLCVDCLFGSLLVVSFRCVVFLALLIICFLFGVGFVFRLCFFDCFFIIFLIEC